LTWIVSHLIHFVCGYLFLIPHFACIVMAVSFFCDCCCCCGFCCFASRTLGEKTACEHLYYFACYGPYLWLARASAPGAHPFLLFWIGFHTLISPAASHSGYEDHWSADLYHYLHHRYFECNYGTPGIPFDLWFGTFRDKLVRDDDDELQKPTTAMSGKKAESDVKATLLGWPENMAFLLSGLVAPSMYLVVCLTQPGMIVSSPQWTSYLIASAPIGAAALLQGPWGIMTFSWKNLVFPFHKDSIWKAVFHFGIGISICAVMPVANLLELVLQEPASVP
jgi:hypothetical protein